MPVLEPRSGPRKSPIPGGRAGSLLRFQLTGNLGREARLLNEAFRSINKRGGILEEANAEALQIVKDKAAAHLAKSIAENRRPQIKQQNRVTLRKVIQNPSSHIVTANGFRFMVEDQVRPQIDYAYSLEYGDRSQIGRNIYFLFLGRVPAERRRGVNRGVSSPFNTSLERTPRAAREFRQSFRPHSGRGNRAAPGRLGGIKTLGRGAPAGAVTDRILGPRELGRSDAPRLKGSQYNQSRFKVKILNPVPTYAYGRKAGRDWEKLKNKAYPEIVKRVYDSKMAELAAKVPLLDGAKAKSRTARSKSKKANLKGLRGNGDVTVGFRDQ